MTQSHSKSSLCGVAKCSTLILTHMAGVKRQFNEYDAIAQKAVAYYVWNSRDFIAELSKHAEPILALMNEIRSLRKMMIRIIQVQRQQINKYRKSIRDGRKTVMRGAPPSLESVTMETMIQMSLRVIQDMKDARFRLSFSHSSREFTASFTHFINACCCSNNSRRTVAHSGQMLASAIVRNAAMASATTATNEKQQNKTTKNNKTTPLKTTKQTH